MRAGSVGLAGLLLAMLLLGSCGRSARETGLTVSYGNNGLEKLSFNGVVLEDLAEHPSDSFHIWHMKALDAHGEAMTAQQYGWGENNLGRSWDAATHTWHYPFTWGSISVGFVQKGNALEVHVTEENKANSGIIFDGATIYPLVLHFPDTPSGFGESSYQHLAVRPEDPPPVADFGRGQVATMADGGGKPLYYGFEPAGGGPNYVPVISSTAMDSIAPSFPHLSRPIAPGTTDSFSVSLKFTTPASSGQ